jgi:prepilin-type processing-associated H-X9-DG protein
MTTGIFVGLSTIDIIYNVAGFPENDRKVVAQSQELIVGGPATNAAITFAFLGGSATLVAPLGRHPLGELVREECRRFGVRLIDLTPDSKEIPPVSSVCVNRQGERTVVSVSTTTTTIPPVKVNATHLEGTQVLMVDGHAMKAGLAWARAARSAGVAVVLDGGSWKPETDVLLKSVDTAICSADFYPPGCNSEEEVIEYLRLRGVTRIAITHGADPLRFIAPSTSGALEVPRVDAVDTMGAGDIFHGAFCFYDTKGHEFEEALQMAAKVASESCRYRGTRKWMEVPTDHVTTSQSWPQAAS